jgi:hypothetical protein
LNHIPLQAVKQYAEEETTHKSSSALLAASALAASSLSTSSSAPASSLTGHQYQQHHRSSSTSSTTGGSGQKAGRYVADESIPKQSSSPVEQTSFNQKLHVRKSSPNSITNTNTLKSDVSDTSSRDVVSNKPWSSPISPVAPLVAEAKQMLSSSFASASNQLNLSNTTKTSRQYSDDFHANVHSSEFSSQSNEQDTAYEVVTARQVSLQEYIASPSAIVSGASEGASILPVLPASNFSLRPRQQGPEHKERAGTSYPFASLAPSTSSSNADIIHTPSENAKNESPVILAPIATQLKKDLKLDEDWSEFESYLVNDSIPAQAGNTNSEGIDSDENDDDNPYKNTPSPQSHSDDEVLFASLSTEDQYP